MAMMVWNSIMGGACDYLMTYYIYNYIHHLYVLAKPKIQIAFELK